MREHMTGASGSAFDSKDGRPPGAEEAKLFKDIFPYDAVPRLVFENSIVLPDLPQDIYITDTTFRDGQQGLRPFRPEEILRLYDHLYRLGGFSGVIRQCEFFLYSESDRRAVNLCRSREYRYPEITGWIRANAKDLALVKEMELSETGILTSVSDYHIFYKLKKDRKSCMADYLEIVEAALQAGIRPRCHFEDITRADIYGFVVPFAQKLMELSRQAGIPIRIRLCDTLGLGVSYSSAALPRSVPKIVYALRSHAGVPAEWLEWHGHNDFYKSVVNSATAWLYGCGGVNCTMLGIGERTGNTPIEAMALEYVSITGRDGDVNAREITAIVEYMEDEMGVAVPPKQPFVGSDFNATGAGIHIDGLAKSESIYNIFDTEKILGRPVSIIITDRSGAAGIAAWINQKFGLKGDDAVDKKDEAVQRIFSEVQAIYSTGRTTRMSDEEMMELVTKYLPHLVRRSSS